MIVKPIFTPMPRKFLAEGREELVMVGVWGRSLPNSADFENCRDRFFEIFDGGKKVGFGGLYKIDDIARSAELSVALFTKEKKNLSRAIVTSSSFGFLEMNLHRIFISFSSAESSLISAAKLAGYQNDGKLRSYFYKAGQYEDLIMVSLLKEEFLKI